MPLIPDAVLNVLKTLKREGYSDQATRRVFSRVASGNSYGRASYDDGDTFPCRFVPKPSPDLLPGANVEMADAELHFDLGFLLLPDDRVIITHMNGQAIPEKTYQIVAGPVQDSLGQSATLKLVKD